jgi:hypothetical protein
MLVSWLLHLAMTLFGNELACPMVQSKEQGMGKGLCEPSDVPAHLLFIVVRGLVVLWLDCTDSWSSCSCTPLNIDGKTLWSTHNPTQAPGPRTYRSAHLLPPTAT